MEIGQIPFILYVKLKRKEHRISQVRLPSGAVVLRDETSQICAILSPMTAVATWTLPTTWFHIYRSLYTTYDVAGRSYKSIISLVLPVFYPIV